MISRIIALLLLFTVFAPFAVAQQTPQKPSTPCTLTAEDYAVYAAVVNDLGKPEDPEEAWKDKEILIVDATTAQNDVKGRKGWGFRSNSKATPGKETVADFEANASSTCPLTESFGNPQSYSIITHAEVDKFFSSKRDGWGKFYKKYPKAAGFWDFSRPGFDTAHHEALIYLGHYCGSLCGTGHLLFLTKENGQWKVTNRLMLWIS